MEKENSNLIGTQFVCEDCGSEVIADFDWTQTRVEFHENLTGFLFVEIDSVCIDGVVCPVCDHIQSLRLV
jgi:hypothetical protein